MVSSLSPFALDAGPIMTVPANVVTEATGPSGAAVGYVAEANDYEEGTLPTTCLPAPGSVFPLGTTAVSCSASDAFAVTAGESFTVTVVDTTAPVVTAPAPLTTPATEAGGARLGSSPPLAAWLASATASDLVDAALVAITPQVNGAPVDGATLFPVGTTTVTFAFRDASGNTATATSTVTVTAVAGTARLDVTLAGAGTLPNGRRFFDLAVTNNGTGIARRAVMLVAALTTRGWGLATVRTPMPISVGDLNPAEARVVRIELSVPSSVRELRLLEAGLFLNAKGQLGVFTGTQIYQP
jgi:hypothetical protein